MRRTYRWDKAQGRMVETTPAEPRPVHFVQDAYAINPTISPVDGTLIACRADLRAHNRRNNCADIGSDPAFNQPKREMIPMPPAGPDIKRAFDRLG